MTTQYRELGLRILNEGYDVVNPRTNVVCRTVVNAAFEYDVGKGEYPLISSRKVGYKFAIAELLGYIHGYTDAQKFADLGAKTWFANANLNKAWLDNPYRKGENDMGKVYGAVARDFGGIDLIAKVVTNLTNKIDDRGEIITFWKPDDFKKGCLRPCMHTHTFSIINDTLHLTSYQRSVDFGLGLVANMQQCYVLLAMMSQVTKLKAGKCYHKMVNIHMYSDQLPSMRVLLNRQVSGGTPTLTLNESCTRLEDFKVSDFTLSGVNQAPAISIPFSV
jgi:thymidylate synthase